MNAQPPRLEDIDTLLQRDRRTLTRKRLVKWAWGLGLCVLVLAGYVFWDQRSQEANTINWETVAVARAPVTVTVNATGTIQPTNQVDVSSELSGIVRRVLVRTNSLVEQGDVLAEIDTQQRQAELARAEAMLRASQAQLTIAEVSVTEQAALLARQESLRTKGLNAQQTLDVAQAASARAQAAVMAAQAARDVAQADVLLRKTELAKSRVLSPIRGIILKRSVDPGQTVASSLQAPILFKIAEDLRRMQLEAQIDEADIGSVSIGQKATFTVDAYPDRAFPASISDIEYASQTTEGVVTYKAVLAIDNADLMLRPGMTATAQIIVKAVADALVVPSAALRFAPPKPQKASSFNLVRMFMPRMPRFERATSNEAPGGARTVWVLEGDAPVKKTVTTGLADGRQTEILTGLVAGDKVIVSVAGTPDK